MWSDYLLIFSQVVWISAIFEKGKFGGLLIEEGCNIETLFISGVKY